MLIPDTGRAELTVAGPEVAGSVEVTEWSRSGRKLMTKRVAAQQLTSATLALPARTALVTTIPDQDEPTLLGAVRVDLGSGSVTLPLRELVLTGLVPAVRPGLDSPRPVGQGPVGQASGS